MDSVEIKADLNNAGTFESFISMSGQKIPILYEDNHLLIVIKPEGVLSQSDGSCRPDMLTLLKEYIKIEYKKPGDVFLGLVHRLDMPVTGVMVFAKTSKAASRISGQIRDKTVTKKYFAIVHGFLREKQGRLQTKLLKNAQNFVEEDEEGKEAVLYYKQIDTNSGKNISLLEITLETGRSHQIRTQLSFNGNPILGDKKYGNLNESYHGDIALFAYCLSFKHPTKDIQMEFKVIPEFKFEWNTFTAAFQLI